MAKPKALFRRQDIKLMDVKPLFCAGVIQLGGPGYRVVLLGDQPRHVRVGEQRFELRLRVLGFEVSCQVFARDE